MASKKIIKSMIELFLSIWPRKNADSTVMTEAYYQALRKYSDDEIRKAGYKAMDELEFFPKPADLKKFLDVTNLRDWFTCPKCGAHVSLLIEGECKYCRAKMPLSIPRPKIKPDLMEIERSPRIEPNIRCQRCGKVTLCIYEDGQWQCRQCYTGLTDEQVAQRFRDLQAIVVKEKTAEQVRKEWGLIDESNIPF